MRKTCFRLLAAICAIFTATTALSQDAGTGGSSGENISSMYSRAGNPAGRVNLGDGSESIDTFSGLLQYSYRDTVIPGDGGFDLPIIRRYANLQHQAQDSTNRVFGQRWDIHFGRIKSNALNANLTQAFCPSALYLDGNFSPAFQAPDGTTHPIYTADPSFPGASTGVTRELHRVTCNDDGTILVESSNGTKYFFGKQRYLKNGTGLQFPEAIVNEDQRVEYEDFLYATRIEDRNGNAFDIDYTLVWSSNGFANSPVFTIDRVRQGSRIAAEFTYDVAPGELTNQTSETPNLILRELKVGDHVLEYTYESVFSGDTSRRFLLNNLTAVSIATGSAQGAPSIDYSYEYYPTSEQDGVVIWQIDDANAGNLKTLTNRFGGTTTYDYQWIASPNGDPFNGVRAINSKTESGLGTWTYSFEQGAQNDGFDRTTVVGPENIRTEYKYCNLTLIANECDQQVGYLVERKVFDGNDSLPLEVETYEWRLISTAQITNQTERIFAFGNHSPFNNGFRFTVFPRVLVHTATTRENVVVSNSRYSFDEFANAGTELELQGNSPIPYGDINGDGVVDLQPGDPLSIESNGIVNPLQSANTIDADNPRVRVTIYEFRNITSPDTWILGLQLESSLFDTPEVASEPASVNDQVTTLGYDSKGNLTSRSDFGSSSSYEYDGNGNLTLAVDPNGNQRIFSDFRYGVAQSESRSLSLGGPAAPVLSRVVNTKTGYVDSFTVVRDGANGESLKTTLEYDNLGRITAITTPRPDDADIAIIFNRNSTVTERGSRTTTEIHDNFGRTTRTILNGPGIKNSNDFEYDAYGRETFRSQPFEDGETLVAAIKKYDALNRLVSETSTVDGLATHYLYNGLVTTLTDRKGNVTVQSYRAFGSFDSAQLMSISQRVDSNASILTEMTRTKTGQLLSVKQGDVTRFSQYDGRYRLKRLIRPETADTLFSYDENGNLKSRRIEGVGRTEYSYDGRDNVVSITYPNSNLLNDGLPSPNAFYQFYDDDLPRSSEKGGILREYTYDENGNVRTELINIENAGSYSIDRQYDELDSLLSMVYPSGSSVDYEPDVLGRPTKVGAYLSSIDYTATGDINSATYGNGLAWQMTRNEHNYIASNTIDNVFEELLSYDESFNVERYESELNHDSNIDSRREYDYLYDGIDRVTSLQKLFSPAGLYQYDDNSNLLVHPLSEIGDTVEVYNTYGNAGNSALLGTIEKISNFNVDFESPVTNDQHGNISSYRGYSFLFDDAGDLRTIRKSGSDVATYEYDADGLRTIINKDGQEIINIYSSGQLLHEVSLATGTTSDYMYLNRYLIAREDTLDDSVDTDGDGIPDVNESNGDADGDGISNQQDLDSDGDGIPDSIELANDDDGDGVLNFLDTDSDNDGILDLDENLVAQSHCSEYLNFRDDLGWVTLSIVEGGVPVQRPYYEIAAFRADGDLDNDGTPNSQDNDIDGDANPDSPSNFGSNEWERNSLYLADGDCDGVPNWYDLDSDGDTIIDSAELPSQSFAEKDDDGDGIPNVYEADSNDNGEIDFKSLNTRLPYFEALLDEDNNLQIDGVDTFRFGSHGQNFVLSSVDLATIAAAAEPRLSYRYQTDRLVAVPPPASNDPSSCNAGAGIFSAPVNFSGNGVSGTGTELIQGNSIGFSEQDLQAAADYLTRQYENQSNCLVASGISSPQVTQYRAITEIETRNYEIVEIPADLSIPWIMEVIDSGNFTFGRAGVVRFVAPYSGDGIDLSTGAPVVYTPLVIQYVSDPMFLPRVRNIGNCFGDTSVPGVELCTFSNSPNLNETDGKIHVSTFQQSDFVFGGMQIDFQGAGVYNLLNWNSFYNDTGWLIHRPPGATGTVPLLHRDFIFEISKAFDINEFDPQALTGFGDIRILAEQTDQDSDGDGILDVIEIGNQRYPRDTDQDGVPDYLDLDSDDDRIPDFLEALFDSSQPKDTDGKGAPDYLDTDSDNDGIPDGIETIGDADNDGIPNFQDIDSDGDRIPDSVEATSTTALLDLDGDGIPNYLDEDADGDTLTDFYESGGSTGAPIDSDGDGNPDYLDTDSDNDGILDIDEPPGESANPGNTGPIDSDSDGLPDDYESQFGLDSTDASDAQSDADADELTALDEFALGTNPTLADTDADGVPDGFEITVTTNPLVNDADGDVNGDGVSNLDEYLLSIEPVDPEDPVDPVNQANELVLDSVNDWGTGHIATYRYVITENDVQSLANISWRIESRYSGDGSISNGWLSGYNAQATTSNDPEFGGFYATNENAGYKPALTAGQAISLSINVNGAGFDASDYAPVFINLSADDGGSDDGGTSDLPDNVEANAINDWYSHATSSGGFNVTFDYVVTSSNLPSANNNSWLIRLDYTGSGSVTNAWVSGFPGQVNSSVVGASLVEYSTFGVGYIPTLESGDVIRIAVQVDGAPYDQGDFDFAFSQ